MWPLIILSIVIFGVACIPRKPMLSPRTDFESDDPDITAALKQSIKEWADNGVSLAQIATVNENVPGVMKFVRAPRGNLHKLCHAKQGSAYRGDGCTAIHNSNWDCVYIADDLTDLRRLKVVVLHELGHIFSCSKLHHDQKGVMHPNATSYTITPADMDYMREYTDVEPSET